MLFEQEKHLNRLLMPICHTLARSHSMFVYFVVALKYIILWFLLQVPSPLTACSLAHTSLTCLHSHDYTRTYGPRLLQFLAGLFILMPWFSCLAFTPGLLFV